MDAENALVRSSSDKWFGGVLGGIAQRYGWPANRVRLAYIVVSILSAAFPGALVYLLLWMVMPEEQDLPREFRVSDRDLRDFDSRDER